MEKMTRNVMSVSRIPVWVEEVEGRNGIIDEKERWGKNRGRWEKVKRRCKRGGGIKTRK